jgi:ubiquinone/menaquinone biosynthesis C-methylase UbiE
VTTEKGGIVSMDKPKSNLDFRMMSLMYVFRDFRLPRMEILKEVGIKAASHVLDFGCGPGNYVVPASTLVGQSGRVYALDIHPLAIRSVQRLVSVKGLANVETILSDCQTGLPDESIDVALLYDTYHNLSEPESVLKELCRVLKPDGVLSFSDHHMKEEEIMAKVTSGGLFRLRNRGKRTFGFSRIEH